MHTLLQTNQKVAIASVSGMTGVGKTELALQYGKAHLADYAGGVCLVNAGVGDVGLQIVNFARVQLDLVPPDDWELSDKLNYCWKNWFDGKVLLIFDDVKSDNYRQQIKPCLPPAANFKVLLTGRETFDRTMQKLPLEVLQPLAAMTLLESLVGSERLAREPGIARELCQWLGYLPLGLELVGRYLSLHPDLSLEKMLARLARKQLKHQALLATNPLMRYELGVEAAFELSWQDLDENAQKLGCYLSLYALAPIRLNLAAIEDDREQEIREEAVFLQAIKIDKRSLPENHPSLATHLNNLALLYRLQGKYAAAEPLYLQALGIFRESLGTSHPNTLTVWQNYATFWKQVIDDNPANLEKLKNHPLGEAIRAALFGE